MLYLNPSISYPLFPPSFSLHHLSSSPLFSLPLSLLFPSPPFLSTLRPSPPSLLPLHPSPPSLLPLHPSPFSLSSLSPLCPLFHNIEFPSVKRENGAVKKWTLNLYGSELTPADIQERKRFVHNYYFNPNMSQYFRIISECCQAYTHGQAYGHDHAYRHDQAYTHGIDMTMLTDMTRHTHMAKLTDMVRLTDMTKLTDMTRCTHIT